MTFIISYHNKQKNTIIPDKQIWLYNIPFCVAPLCVDVDLYIQSSYNL